MQGYAAGAEVVELRPVVFSVAADERQLPVGLLVEGAAARKVIFVNGVGLLCGFQPQRLFYGVPHRQRLFEDKADVYGFAVLLQAGQYPGDGLAAAEEAPTVAEVGHAVAVERDAQVEAPRTGGKLLVDGLALAAGKGEHESAPPAQGRQVAHRVVRADDCLREVFFLHDCIKIKVQRSIESQSLNRSVINYELILTVLLAASCYST